MTLEALAVIVVDTAERVGVEFMAVGASGDGAFGVQRSTKDVDLLVPLDVAGGASALAEALAPSVEFDRPVQFDRLPWGGRIVGRSRSVPPFKVELSFL